MMTTGPKLIPVSVEIAQNELEWKAPFLHLEERRDIFFVHFNLFKMVKV